MDRKEIGAFDGAAAVRLGSFVVSWIGASQQRIRMDAKALLTARTTRYRARYLRIAEELTQELLQRSGGGVRAVLLDRDVAQGVVPGDHQFPLWVITEDNTLDTVSRLTVDVVSEITEKNNYRLWLHTSTYSVKQFVGRVEAGYARPTALLEGSVIIYDDGLIAGMSSQMAEQT